MTSKGTPEGDVIQITAPVFGAFEEQKLIEALRSGWVVQGPNVEEFERQFNDFVGSNAAVAVSSCTTGLHLAAVALGVMPGEEVLVPAFTWIATANAVELAGGRVRFVDIDLDTFNIDPADVARKLTDAVVGIIPVHLFGLAAPMRPLIEQVDRSRRWVLEDAACAFGTTYEGHHVGKLGHAGVFSFHPRKAITTGEGGMLTTFDVDLAAKFRQLRDHGLDGPAGGRPSDMGDYSQVGFNYRMTDLQGALGVAQMERAGELLMARARVARAYDELLADLDWLRLPSAPKGQNHAYQSYVVLYAPKTPSVGLAGPMSDRRNDLMDRLKQAGISTRPGTHAPAFSRYYSERYGIRPWMYPNAYMAERLSIALPIHPRLTDRDLERVSDALHAWSP